MNALVACPDEQLAVLDFGHIDEHSLENHERNGETGGIEQYCFPWFEMALKEDANGFWVAEVEGELAGVTLSWVRGSLWYLAHLFVSPDHQGLDIGKNLPGESIATSEGVADR